MITPLLRLTAPLLALAACSRAAAPASGPELLAAAHRALGVSDSIRTIWAVATVASPSGGFLARIASATDGRVRLALGQGLVAGVQGGQGWVCDSVGQVAPLDSITRSVVRGHDLHMLIVAPSWLAAPTREPDQRWGEHSVLTLRFQDELGAPLLMRLRATDSVPVGLDLVNHSGAGPREVRVRLENWRAQAGVRLFRSATFEHGGNRFVYSYTELAINILPDSAFQPGCAPRAGAGAG
jgi:hypothetical protein